MIKRYGVVLVPLLLCGCTESDGAALTVVQERLRDLSLAVDDLGRLLFYLLVLSVVAAGLAGFVGLFCGAGLGTRLQGTQKAKEGRFPGEGDTSSTTSQKQEECEPSEFRTNPVTESPSPQVGDPDSAVAEDPSC